MFVQKIARLFAFRRLKGRVLRASPSTLAEELRTTF
jgi:hypothetical protein